MPHLPRFFVHKEALRLGNLALPPGEARHAAKALRLRAGDRIEIGDGEGRLGAACLMAVRGEEAIAKVEAIHSFPEPRPHLVLATAIPKGKRWQWLVEKCVELGAASIQPLRFRRSVAQGEGGREKWERWALEAGKQSRRLYLPRVFSPLNIADFLLSRAGGPIYWATPEGEMPTAYLPRLQNAEEIVILIGPEGDLAEDERAACAAVGALPLRLGPHILRVETAAAAACAIAVALSRR